MLRATFNNTPQMNVRSIGGTSVGQYWPGAQAPQNVGQYWLRGFNNEDASLPNGINNETALQMPVNTGGKLEAQMTGDAGFFGSIQGAGVLSATLTGESDVFPAANTAAMGYATLTGINTTTANLRAVGRMSAVLDAGARPSAFDIAQEILGSATEGTVTVRQALRLLLAVLAGKVSGAGTGTVVFRDVNDTKNRVTATVDSNGNRTSVTRDVS